MHAIDNCNDIYKHYINRTPSKAPEPVVAYMRYSSNNQNYNSIEYQKEHILAYCFKHNLQLIDSYIDEGYSGTNDNRPDFQKLMAEVQTHPKWKKVLIYDFSRFARNKTDASRYTDLLSDNDISLISVTQEFGNSPEGELLVGLMHLINEFYSKNNAKHTHAGMKAKAEQGKHCGGKPPLGYDLDENNFLIINEYEAQIVREIFDMYLLNYSYSRMAEILNEKGYRTKKDKPFNKNSFSSILSQKKYIGTFSWNKQRAKNSKGKHNSHALKPEEERVYKENGCPQIISTEQFEKVQEKMASNQSGYASSKCRHHYMLSSLKILKCAECGSLMIGTTRTSHGDKYTTYYCPKHKRGECSMKEIKTEFVDNFVARAIASNYLKDANLAQISAELKKNKSTKKLESKLRGIHNSQANILKSICKESDEALRLKLKSLSQEETELKEKIEQSKLCVIDINSGNKKSVYRQLVKYLIESDDVAVKQLILSRVTEILVGSDDIRVSLHNI